jgi:hypothetical protein
LLQQRIASLPGVEVVGVSDNIPMNLLSTNSATLAIEGVPAPPGREGFDIDRVSVDTGYFAATGIRLLRGRGFQATDVDGAALVAIVNQAFVDRFWSGRDGLGQHLRTRDGRSLEIIGVVNTTKIRTLGEDPRPAV